VAYWLSNDMEIIDLQPWMTLKVTENNYNRLS